MRRSLQFAVSASKLVVPLGFIAVVAAQGPPPLGAPLPGLSQTEMGRFNAGRLAFGRNFTPQSGLGPVFNGTSCQQCHHAGAPGGASADLNVSVVTRIGGLVNGGYSDLVNVGGALIQARSLREIIPNYPVPREVVPGQATFVAHRITTPLFGAGLIEAIPAASILARQDPLDLNHDGISGRANMVLNPESHVTEVGRFGWKSQVTALHVFSGDAYLNEMGITNPTFPREVLPQGKPIPPGADPVADPEDKGLATNQVTDFMRFLAPPPPGAGNTQGASLFTSTGCVSCHTAAMTTGANAVPALANKQVRLYSDLLLHDMGTQLGDGIRQGVSSGTEFRTAPLWGLRFRRFLLHDGRAQSPDQAIRLHGGEAASAVSKYVALPVTSKSSLISFLLGL